MRGRFSPALYFGSDNEIKDDRHEATNKFETK